MAARRPIGVLFSGGLDSAALVVHLLRAQREVWPIYVRSGLRWEREEIRMAERFVREMKHPNLRPLAFARLRLENAYKNNWSQTGHTPDAKSDDRSVFLPARNLLLLTKALLSLSSDGVFAIAIATLKGNPFADGRASYFRLLEKVLSGGFAKRVSIVAPFRTMTKVEVIRRAKGAPIHLSLSCISPLQGRHCGRCNKCEERRAAFQKAGIEDRTIYSGRATRSSS